MSEEDDNKLLKKLAAALKARRDAARIAAIGKNTAKPSSKNGQNPKKDKS